MIEFIGRKPQVMIALAIAIALFAFTIVFAGEAAAAGGVITQHGESTGAYASVTITDDRSTTIVDVSVSDYSDPWGEGSSAYVNISTTRNGSRWQYAGGYVDLTPSEFTTTPTGAVLDTVVQVCSFRGKNLKETQCVDAPVHVEWIGSGDRFESSSVSQWTDGACTITSTSTSSSEMATAIIQLDYKALSALEGFGELWSYSWRDEYSGEDCVVIAF